jgi:xanthine dehydrogenase YagR molybdenum-binding subunit
MIGQPLSRVDGPLKVSGRATYAYEEWNVGQPLYGFVVGATIGRGRIAAIDTTRAERSPGVRRVMTHRDAPAQGQPDLSVPSGYSRALPVLASDDVRCFGQPVALVVAETFEQARAAAWLVDVSYDVAPGAFDFASSENTEYTPKQVNAGLASDTAVGDFENGFATSPVQIDLTYSTPYAFSQPLEPHNCLAAWDGDTVTLHASSQVLSEGKKRIAATFGLAPDKIRILSPFVGGGFGSKLGLHAEAVLAVMAARELHTPVKVALTRQQMFHIVGNRAATRQRVRLGAERDGRLEAFGHDVVCKASAGDDYIEQTACTGRGLYAAPNRRTTHRAIALDLPLSEDVRAPGEAPGLMAIESAMDELAYALDIDPIELRMKNEPALHPELGVPFGDRRLVECMREGARRFGWGRRPKRVASVGDGRWLVGYGMAASIRPHFQGPTTVRVRLDATGRVLVQSDMTDIGTGTYTIMTQLASEALGVPIDRVRVELGDSSLPPSSGSGASWGATNSCLALTRACRALRDHVLATVSDEERAPAADLTALVAKNLPSGAEGVGSIKDMWAEPNFKTHALIAFGAHFAEVHVDRDTGETRLQRMLGVFDIGRVFNPKTARSQLIGGMAWGVAMALHEEGIVDTRAGSFINRDFAQYLVPVHADIPAIDAVLLDGYDENANELGAKGAGEIGNCGSGAAVANAVYNATGVRVRDFPITIEKLLPGLPVRS